jgi:LacI family transcriptional regulator
MLQKKLVFPLRLSPRVISGRGGVSQHLTEQVNQAIASLNYRPNRVARNLRVRKAKTVGIVVSDIANHFLPVSCEGFKTP